MDICIGEYIKMFNKTEELIKDIDWSKQICGLHQAPIKAIYDLMPDLVPIIETFPDAPENFSWDVKVHMLMPNQYPCIPNWHLDNIPRINGIQRMEMIQPYLPMYLWISNPPLTQFKNGYLEPRKWHRFYQTDEHRGNPSDHFGWRGFIRATHIGIQPIKRTDYVRKHIQVYLDAESYQW